MLRAGSQRRAQQLVGDVQLAHAIGPLRPRDVGMKALGEALVGIGGFVERRAGVQAEDGVRVHRVAFWRPACRIDAAAPDPHRSGLAPRLAGRPPRSCPTTAGYSRPHTLHCGPDGVFLTCIGGPEGDEDGPGGIALLDHNTFEVLRAWETDRGPQHFHYDAWWHLNRNVLISSEWGSPSMIENGVVPDLLLGKQVRPRHPLLGPRRRHAPAAPRPRRAAPDGARGPPLARPGGDVGLRRRRDLHRGPVRLGVALVPRRRGEWQVEKVITIPAEPADPDLLPPALAPFGAVPPLITDIDLSVDDRFLYVSCWGTGELKQFDVTDPAHPVQVGSVQLGGIVGPDAAPGGARPAARRRPADGRGQPGRAARLRHQLALRRLGRPVLSRRRRRLDGEDRRGTRRRVHASTPRFFPHGDEFRGLRVHQIRLQGGDASSDSYCYG